MATTFQHEIEAVDGLTVRFTSKKVHPDAGIEWPWHHAIHALARIEPLDQNPIAGHLGDDRFDDTLLEARHTEIFSEVVQTQKNKKLWVTTVRFTHLDRIPSTIAAGHRWESGA